jgi:hypothetical protein
MLSDYVVRLFGSPCAIQNAFLFLASDDGKEKKAFVIRRRG